ncbi:hypothetical protein MRB53_012929 [Persea americana]|uniref:Uncharacterized protein n=1 Tax=Persea americana TaxID=3435 RepID=A0ACC2LZ08_PERAE|nr:hypothetical protein MRB53_012929 [Persea americana]
MIRSSSTRSNVKEQDIANRKNRRVLVFGVKKQEEKELLRVRRRTAEQAGVCLALDSYMEGKRKKRYHISSSSVTATPQATASIVMDFLSNAPPISLVVTAAKVLLALLVFKVCFFYLGGRWSVRKREYHPIAGTTIQQLLNFSRLHDYFTDLAYRHKTFRILTPGTWEVFTVDPANIEYILKTNFENYAKGRHQYNILKDFLGEGIFTVDGEKWRHQRKLASYDFSTRALREFSSTVFQINAAKLAQIVSEEATSNQAMDIQDLFMKSTLSSIFKVGFGTELNALQGLREEESKFNKAFDESSALTLWRYLDVFWKIKKLLNIGSEAILKENIKVINEFVCKQIRSKKDHMSSWQLDSKEKDDMLSRFLDGKICLSDDTLPDGFNVREGDMVAYLPYAMGRMKFLWGDEADVFRPERWLDKEGIFQPESPFKFTAFQAGPRICIGKEFAYRQMKIFVAVLLHFFTFKLMDENKAVKYRTMINLHIDQGLYLHAYHR